MPAPVPTSASGVAGGMKTAELQQQLDQQSAEIAELRAQLQQLTSLLQQQVSGATDPNSTATAPTATDGPLPSLPPPTGDTAAVHILGPGCGQADGCGESDRPTKTVPVTARLFAEDSCGDAVSTDSIELKYLADYDSGFLIRPVDPEANPFRLKVNGWIQFRHIGFSRDRDSWTDNAGITRPVLSRNAFDIERARLVFSGNAMDERLSYFLHLDGDTDGRDSVDFFDYWWAWKFSDRLRLQFGKRKVPASRQWLRGARNTRLSERPMATDFFRPDRSLGLFASGSLSERSRYELMLGNGYRTANRNATDINKDFAVAGTWYTDVGGSFGKYLTDHECSENPLFRIGHSFAWAGQDTVTTGIPLSESDFVRLADGTRLIQTGALAPGVTVDEFDTYFYAVDVAGKYQGWSINSEVYFRWLQDLAGDGALPTSQIFQRGFYVEGGRVILPEKLDWNIRYSQVSGPYGNASEYAGGINWFPIDTRKFKITFDVTYVDGSPLRNTATELLPGDVGTLFRTQIQAEF